MTIDPAVATPFIDPEFADNLDVLPAVTEWSDAALTALRRQRQEALASVELSDEVLRTDHRVPGTDGAPDVTVRVHRPRDAEGPLPCVYSIHGGGYIVGTYEMEDARLDRWCSTLGCAAVAVDYRLAPETPYPGPLEDCYAGLRWVHRHAGELGIDPARTGIAGASAGGGLAAALALLARDRGELPIAFQLLIYPMIDDRQQTPSSRWDVPVWNPAANAYGWRAYLGERYGTEDVPATAAPARALDLRGLPPAFVCVGTADVFCSEDIIYAQRLVEADVQTELHVYPGAPHGFDLLPGATGRRCRREVANWLGSRLAAP